MLVPVLPVATVREPAPITAATERPLLLLKVKIHKQGATRPADLTVGLVLSITAIFIAPGPIWAQFGAPSSPFAGQSTPAERAKVGVELVKQYDVVAPGQRFAVAVILDIDSGWHLYANPIGDDSGLGLPTQIIPEPAQDLWFGIPIYPEGDSSYDDILKVSLNIYEGRVICYLPIEVSEQAQGEIPLRLNLDGLLCDKSCVPWKDQADTTLTVSATAAATEIQPEIFTGLNLDDNKIWKVQADTVGTAPTPRDTAEVYLPDYQPREFEGARLAPGQWLRAMLLALVAGVILNLMPCVLPVIPLKVLSLIQQGQADAESGDKYKAVKLAAVFGLGIILVFVALAVVMSAFKLLYGQQFQSLTFKFIMLMIIFVLGLSMLGLFEVILPSRISNVQIVRQGYLGALGMGILATLLATPCSAPLLGPVLTWSLSKPLALTVAVFLVIGVGMSAPYLLLTAFPGLIKRIPKAGNWMIRLKQGLGFSMLAVAAYLVCLFPPNWHLPLIIFCLILAFAVWLAMTVVTPVSSTTPRLWARLIATTVLACGAGMLYVSANPTAHTTQQEFSTARLQQLHQEGRNVMVEFTADWCPNCKWVEKTVLEKSKFQEKLIQKDMTLMIADWTHQDPAITRLLNKLGSKSIPFTAVFAADDPLRPIVLRDIYSLDSILAVLDSL